MTQKLGHSYPVFKVCGSVHSCNHAQYYTLPGAKLGHKEHSLEVV